MVKMRNTKAGPGHLSEEAEKRKRDGERLYHGHSRGQTRERFRTVSPSLTL